MPKYIDFFDSFDDEVLFQVGERVRVRIAEDVLPVEDIICDTGIVRQVFARFMLTPKMRRIEYKVWLDNQYHPFYDHGLITVFQDKLSKLERKEKG